MSPKLISSLQKLPRLSRIDSEGIAAILKELYHKESSDLSVFKAPYILKETETHNSWVLEDAKGFQSDSGEESQEVAVNYLLPRGELPRERLLTYGVKSLAVWELLAIILGTGTKGKSVIDLAQELVKRFGGLHGLLDASVAELTEIKGIGRAKAILLKAAFGIALKTAESSISTYSPIETPQAAYELIRWEMVNKKQEILIVILRDVKGRLIHHERVFIGTLSEVLIHPREVFHLAVRHKAHSLIIAHNHPSGDPTPSDTDIKLTNLLIQSSQIMGIALDDHLIVGDNKFVSLREKGFIGRVKTYSMGNTNPRK